MHIIDRIVVSILCLCGKNNNTKIKRASYLSHVPVSMGGFGLLVIKRSQSTRTLYENPTSLYYSIISRIS